MTSIIVSLAVGYLAIVGIVYLLQSKMVYHPYNAMTMTPAELGYEFEEVHFSTDDRYQLHGWFVPRNTANLTILYLHGNAGNISGRMETIQLLHQLGLNVFIFDYRGYGKSEGSPTEKGTYRDATAAWNFLTEKKEISAENIVIMGRSLGGSIAAWLASKENPAAVIIESTFTSAADLGSEIYPWLPVRWMLKFEYPTLEYVQKIDEPIFMAHSREDNVVPFHHGKTLFANANEPKKFVELVGPHGGGFIETGARYRNALKEFLSTHISYQHK